MPYHSKQWEENPSISDILGWQEDWYGEEQWTPQGPRLGLGGESGQMNMAHYLDRLMSESGAYDTSITGTGVGGGLRAQYLESGVKSGFEELDYRKAMEGLYSSEDFMDMSRSDLEEYMKSTYAPELGALGEGGEYSSTLGWKENMPMFMSDPQRAFEAQDIEGLYGMSEEDRNKALYGQYETFYEGLTGPGDKFETQEDFMAAYGGDVTFDPTYKDIQFEEGDLDEMLNYAQMMQEGLGRTGTIMDKFDLSGQLGGEERSVERKGQEALRTYMPREIASRYGSLQRGGEGAAGEAAEAEYLSALSSAERRKGRNVRSIYGELEEDIFGGLGKWMGNVTS